MKVFSFVLVCILCVLSACSSPESPRAKVYVSAALDGFVIVHKDSIDYGITEIDINGDYQYKLSSLKVGEEKMIGLREFTNDDNVRFDWKNMKVQKITVWATLPDGNHAFSYFETNK